MHSLLARFAESAFWLARYMERAENLARVLDVNESFARDGQGAPEWLPIVQIHSDDERFFARFPKATADAVVAFYVTDRDNPNSILSSVAAARENARSLRHLISVEVWRHLNVCFNRLRALRKKDLKLNLLPDLCARIREDCQLHAGTVDGTLYRDQVWYFCQLGRHLERADQTTRLLDIKYHRLLRDPKTVGSAVDVSQWNALLRSAAAYHGFRRVHPRGMRPENVAGFLLFDGRFPRSVIACLAELHHLLNGLATIHGARVGPVRDALSELEAHVARRDVAGVIETGLHAYLDTIQLRLVAVTNALGRAFFGGER